MASVNCLCVKFVDSGGGISSKHLKYIPGIDFPTESRVGNKIAFDS